MPPADAAMTASMPLNLPDPNRRRIVGLWLVLICVLVFLMVVIGGLTRLTESGLSMVEWKPLTGWLPPFTDAAWQAVFEKYRASPEYRKLNTGMTLDAFKSIFWLEYVHRLWGRLIGVVVFVPLVFFAVRRRLDPRLGLRLVALFVLGGLQGVLGWYMVRSGLIEEPWVSPYRLSAHLGLALLIYGYALWLALGLLRPPAAPGVTANRCRAATALCVLIAVTILSGGFVAGNDAGLTYNTFPLMDGRLVPPGLLDMTPWYRNLFENIATVQFGHRLLAVATLIATLALWAWLRGPRGDTALSAPVRRLRDGLAAAAVVQAGLGVATLLLAVPLALAALHQAVALAVFTLALWLRFELGRFAGKDGGDASSFDRRASNAVRLT